MLQFRIFATFYCVSAVEAFVATQTPRRRAKTLLPQSMIEWSDFDDDGDVSNGPDNGKTFDVGKLLEDRTGTVDYTAIGTRQFSLGRDVVVSNYVGTMGFDEVTDWEYYYPTEDDRSDQRQVVQPNPFDASQPRRTRTSSGSVVRIFRGEFMGLLGGTISAKGLDKRVIIKEYTGDLALSLAKAEMNVLGRMQSFLVESEESAKLGEWIQASASRSIQLKRDCDNVVTLQRKLSNAPFLGAFGEVNLAEADFDQNDFYRSLGVKSPDSSAVWVVYEYAGFSTLQSCSVPGQIRRAKLPPKRGIFGNAIAPPPLPPWNERANFVVQGILKKTILAVASLHENGLVHRSLGQSSIILTTKAMDKRDINSPYFTRIGGLEVKLSDFGFAGPYDQSADDEEMCTRARAFGLAFRKGENNVRTANFSIAEDLHALGFVFLSLLLTSLAELPSAGAPLPAADEDTLQRLLGEIFERDFREFREYVDAEDGWTELVGLLDKDDSAGWKVLETLLTAREKVASIGDSGLLLSARGLLASPFFAR